MSCCSNSLGLYETPNTDVKADVIPAGGASAGDEAEITPQGGRPILPPAITFSGSSIGREGAVAPSGGGVSTAGSDGGVGVSGIGSAGGSGEGMGVVVGPDDATAE